MTFDINTIADIVRPHNDKLIAEGRATKLEQENVGLRKAFETEHRAVQKIWTILDPPPPEGSDRTVLTDDIVRLAERVRDERDQLYGYVNGLLGLLQLVRGRDDMPAEINDALRTNHRAVDAAAYLTQIVPPHRA